MGVPLEKSVFTVYMYQQHTYPTVKRYSVLLYAYIQYHRNDANDDIIPSVTQTVALSVVEKRSKAEQQKTVQTSETRRLITSTKGGIIDSTNRILTSSNVEVSTDRLDYNSGAVCFMGILEIRRK